ncbi:Protein LIFEGUARD 2 [Vigna angularis]|uniref:Protein LIFEGUARD 2 n=1 Tax=Phaseolus angularis TaxID=3914 RepID=A0A8T0KST6_PHAAN|nr:Protein LIFEGUARD 2 [Vigna angularis]
MWNQPYGKTDLESGARPLYPMMLESPELRWSFIRKVASPDLIAFNSKHPVNYLLLGLFTVSLSFVVGLSCAFTSEKVILEAVILTAVVVIGLTLYTFWAARRGQDFNFLGPFLFGAVLVLMVFALIQVLFPLGKLSVMIYGCLAALIFCGYIVYDTDNLIKRYSYDEFIWASVSLYLDIINLFLSLLTIFRAADN